MEHGVVLGIGIYSRSEDSEYSWLLNRLKEDWPVYPFYITNNNHFQLQQHVQKCKFALLYHTKNRGRVNITNVTDSLYDEEITFLSRVLGRDRVIVIIDDLDDSSNDTKERILQQQHSLRQLTRDIFLFTRQEKEDNETLRPKVQIIKDLILEDMYPDSNMKRIIQAIVVLIPNMIIRDTYYAPYPRNVLLSCLWVTMFGRTLCRQPSKPLLPFSYRGRSILCCAVTLSSAYNAYCRPSVSTVTPSVLWIAACSRIFPRRYRMQTYINGDVWPMMAYGLALFSFWRAYHAPDLTKASQQIFRFVLLSPAILAAQ